MKNGQGAEACFAKALVALDLSPATRQLVSWLYNLRLIGTKTLLLVHIIPESIITELAHFITPAKLLDHYHSRAARLLRSYALELSKYGFEVETLSPKHGNPAEWVAKLAELHDVDYIVIGSKGHSLLRSILLGSTAEEVVNTAPRPVLMARITNTPPPSLEDGPIIAALDFDLYMDDVLACAATIAARARNNLILLHVLEAGEDRDEAREKLEGIAGILRKHGIAVTVVLLEAGKPAKLVVDYARRVKASMILIGPGSPQPPLRFTGFTGEAIVRSASTNVFVCRKIKKCRYT